MRERIRAAVVSLGVLATLAAGALSARAAAADPSDDATDGRAVPRSTSAAAGITTPAQIPSSKKGNGARFIAKTSTLPPQTMAPGQTVRVLITMLNTGKTTWTRKSGYRLGMQNPRDNRRFGVGRVDLSETQVVRPGQSKTFRFKITAPTAPGAYNFQARMVRERVEWFGDFTSNVPVVVAATGAVTTPPATPPSARKGKVRLDGWQAVDDGGPFNAVGFTFFSALRFYHKKEFAQMDKDLDAAVAAGYHFARILGEVGWSDGLAIEPTWSDYDETLTGYIRHAWSKGLRTELTLFGGSAWTMEDRNARQNRKEFVQRVIRLIQPLQEMLMYVEIVNEPGVARKFNDVDEMAELARMVQSAMPGLIVAMGAAEGGQEAKYAAKGFPVTLHLDRSHVGTPWRTTRQPWDPSEYVGRPWSNNEPLGPGSSVNEDKNCERQKGLHMMTFIGKGFATVFHSGAGVYGVPGHRGYVSGQVADMPCFKDIPYAVSMLPQRLPQYTRKNGHWSDAPFKNFDPFDVGGDSGRGCMRAYSGVSGDDFATVVLNVPQGIKFGCNTLSGKVTVFNLEPFSVETTVECAPGVAFELGKGSKLMRRPLPAAAYPN